MNKWTTNVFNVDKKYECCGISAHSISLLREELLSQNFACIVEEASILGPCFGFFGCSANSGLQKMSRFCGNSSYGEVLNNGIQEGKSYHVNLKTFLIRVSTHHKKCALLTFVDHLHPSHRNLPKGCSSHPHKKQGTFFKFGLMCRIGQGATHCHSGS